MFEKDRVTYEKELKAIQPSLPAVATVFGSTVSLIGICVLIAGILITYYTISGVLWLSILISLFISFFLISKYKRSKNIQNFP